MRKFITTSLLIIMSLSTQAQSLMDLFNSSSSSSTSTKKEERIPLTQASIQGEWSYEKLTAALDDNSPLKAFGGDAIIGQVAGMLNNTSSSAGLTPGLFSILFKDKGAAILRFNENQAKGKYRLDKEHKEEASQYILVEIGKIDDIEIGVLNAKTTIYKDSITLLFDAKELIAIADKIPSIAENENYKMVKGVAGKIEGLLLGFSMQKRH